MRAWGSICFLGKRTWGYFLKKVSRPPSKTFYLRYNGYRLCNSGATNDQKPFATSLPWHSGMSVLISCVKKEMLLPRIFFAYLLDKPAWFVLYYLYIHIPYRVDGMEYTKTARSESSRLVRDCRSVRGSDPGAAFPKQFFRGTLFVRTRVAFVRCA